MPATIIHVGPPAHDNERQAIEFLASKLPASVTVFANPWLIEPSGAVYELDAVVVMPHAIYVVEIKGWHGHITAGEHDWYVPGPRRSPLKLARKTAQILKSLLSRHSRDAGRCWVQELVFLPAVGFVQTDSAAVEKRIAQRHDIHAILQDPQRVLELSRRRRLSPIDDEITFAARTVLDRKPKTPPTQALREYDVLETLDATDRYREVFAEHRDLHEKRVLRVYRVPWAGTVADAQRQKVRERALWEARILRSLGNSPPDVHLLQVDAPFEVDEGVVVPFEAFQGETLPSWLQRHGSQLSLEQKVHVWGRIARTLAWTHDSGVVHRKLRPELVLISGEPPPRGEERSADLPDVDLRVTGFDMAKREGADSTVARSSIVLEELEGAAPEVLNLVSDATAHSDQFSLGLLLAFLILGEPLVESTVDLVRRRHRIPRLRDKDPNQKKRIDTAIANMLSMRPADRYPSVAIAIEKVEEAAFEQTRPSPTPEGLQPGPLGDYLVRKPLGSGGLSDVYAAKHLLKGQHCALKVARRSDAAETALRREWTVLHELKHPNVVGVVDLTTALVPERTTLVLEQVRGPTLTRWVQDQAHADADVSTRRRLAEGLLKALDEFERLGVTHNDLKPDNLMVAEDGLVLIDFSLAHGPMVDEDEPDLLGGTHEWRDPALASRTHGSDRFSAAMCLFYLHVGRHPFDGSAPEPGVAPEIDPAEIGPLAPFFARALQPSPDQRFPSARALREAYLSALGEAPETPLDDVGVLESATPLSQAGLSNRAVRCLIANRTHTVGQLLALTDPQLTNVPGLGPRSLEQVRDLIARARKEGVQAALDDEQGAPPFFRPLLYDLDSIYKLALDTSVLERLSKAGLNTIADIARTPRADLGAINGIGAHSLVKLGEALLRRHEEKTRSADLATLDALWHRAAAGLDEATRKVLDGVVGLTHPPRQGNDVARELGLDPAGVSTRKTTGLERLDRSALEPGLAALDGYLEGQHGLMAADVAADRLARDLPANGIAAQGFIRLACACEPARFQLLDDLPGEERAVLLRPELGYTRALISDFLERVGKLVDRWPPEPDHSARYVLRSVLPDYTGDPLILATRLKEEVFLTRGGALFRPPVDPDKAIAFVLQDARDATTVDELAQALEQTFQGKAPRLPPSDELPELLRGTGWHLEADGRVLKGEAPRFAAPDRPTPDTVPLFLQHESRTPEQVARDVLRSARKTSSYRLVVADASHASAIADSLVRALDATPIDLTDAWFQRHAASLAVDAKSARFAAMRMVLANKVDALFDALVQEHGAPGRTLVVHRTGILEALGGLDQVRTLYDRVQGGQHGFWVLVVPGVIHGNQPLFNERTPIWHQPGLTVPLDGPLPPPASAP